METAAVVLVGDLWDNLSEEEDIEFLFSYAYMLVCMMPDEKGGGEQLNSIEE